MGSQQHMTLPRRDIIKKKAMHSVVNTLVAASTGLTTVLTFVLYRKLGKYQWRIHHTTTCTTTILLNKHNTKWHYKLKFIPY
jgi:hypothetical protein